MKQRSNRNIETEAVNKTRTFFEKNSCVFQEVNLSNDYGKDAYVDFVEGGSVTGICFALQIKGGKSYRRGENYGITLDYDHAKIWRSSTVPIIGIVYDPSDSEIRWCNISNFLDTLEENQKLPSYIPVLRSSILTAITLKSELIASLLTIKKWHIEHPILFLNSESVDVKLNALYDCFALGRSDARVLITLRYLIKTLDNFSVLTAIRILSHTTPHPDIFWNSNNWIPEKVTEKVRSHLNWEIQEICYLLSAVTWENWQRGDYGEDLYMILREDSEIHQKMEEVAIFAIDHYIDDVAFTALYLSIYWAGEHGFEKYQKMLSLRSDFQRLSLVNDLYQILSEFGYIILFE